MSKARSFKYLAKQAELKRAELVAIAETRSPETGGGEGVAAQPGALKFELINRVQIFSQKASSQPLAPSSTSAIPPDSISPPETVTISEAPTNSILAAFSPSAGVDTNLGAEGLGLEGIGAVGASEAQDGGVPVREAITEPVPVRARIYARPLNPKMRLIEFMDGPRMGEHGSLWIRMGDAGNTMLNWIVWVKPDVNRPTPPGVHWVMDGEYNWRGIRVK